MFVFIASIIIYFIFTSILLLFIVISCNEQEDLKFYKLD